MSADAGPDTSGLDLTYINVNGARLAYREAGSGETVVLVHANLSDIRSWDTIFPLLATKFRVVAYSRRYAWPNEPVPSGDADPWERQADDLATLIKSLGLGAVHIVGNSTGATLGLLLAKKHPEAVRSLFLEEPPVVTLFLPKTPPSLLDVVKLLVWHPMSFLTIMSFGIFAMGQSEAAFKRNEDRAAVENFTRAILQNSHFEKLTEERWEQLMANAGPHKALFCHGSLPKFLENDAKSISVPTYLFTAEETAPAQKIVSAYLATLIPGAKEFHFDGISHFLHEDDPEVVANKIFEIAGADH